MSYDEVDALADFGRAHRISFPLLSDPDSEIIERFGILNTEIDPDDHPWYGIPFPGAYAVDGHGVIVAALFEQTFMLRPSADQLLAAALGRPVSLAAAPPSTATAEEVSVDVVFDGDVWNAAVVRDIVVRFAVPPGQHLYGEPVPAGMVATSVEIEPELGLVVRPAVLPPTRTHRLAGTGEQLQVFEGEVVVRVPVAHVSRSLTELDDGSFVQRVAGTVRWQACDDDVCHLPQSERFELEIPAAPSSTAESEVQNPDGMDVVNHMVRLASRRTDQPLGELLTKMRGDVETS